jgi:pilus assembly protein CpaB
VAVPQSVASEVEGSTPNTTKLMLDKVLVTAVQQVVSNQGLGSSSPQQVNKLETAPSESLLVTLAVRPYDADRVVFTAEWGRLWLAAERASVPATNYPAQSRGSIYTDQVPTK